MTNRILYTKSSRLMQLNVRTTQKHCNKSTLMSRNKENAIKHFVESKISISVWLGIEFPNFVYWRTRHSTKEHRHLFTLIANRQHSLQHLLGFHLSVKLLLLFVDRSKSFRERADIIFHFCLLESRAAPGAANRNTWKLFSKLILWDAE